MLLKWALTTSSMDFLIVDYDLITQRWENLAIHDKSSLMFVTIVVGLHDSCSCCNFDSNSSTGIFHISRWILPSTPFTNVRIRPIADIYFSTFKLGPQYTNTECVYSNKA